MARPSTFDKTTILEAAATVIEREGGGKLTLDRVAKEAGISKGGLLHLFPNKKALLQGLVNQFKEALQATFQQDSALTPRQKLRRYIEAHVQGLRENRYYSSLFTSAAADPESLVGVTDFYRECLNEFTDDSLPETTVSLIMMAVEGVAMFHALGVQPLGEEAEQQLIEAVFSMIDE